MTTATKRKTSLTLDGASLDAARALNVNVSAVAEAALKRAIAEAQQKKWIEDNADAFAAQAEWHAQNDHPLADILAGPGAETWKR